MDMKQFMPECRMCWLAILWACCPNNMHTSIAKQAEYRDKASDAFGRLCPHKGRGWPVSGEESTGGRRCATPEE